MQTVLEWLAVLVVAFALMWSSSSHAAFPATYNPATKSPTSGITYSGAPNGACWASGPAACDAAIAAGARPPGSYFRTSDSRCCTPDGYSPAGCINTGACTQYCGVNYTYSGGTCNRNAGVPEYQCPVGGTLSGTNCTCGTGYVESGGTCVPVTCSAGSDQRTITWFQGHDTNRDGSVDTYPGGGNISTGVTRTYDVGGCQYTFDGNVNSISCESYASAPTKVYCSASFKQNGSTSTGTEGTPTTPDGSGPCPSGQSYGTVNGVGGCYASGSPPTPSTPSKTSTQQNVVDNGNGTSTQTTTKTNPDGSTTTTVTIINNTTGQQQPGTTSTTETKLNPSAESAKNSGQGPTEQAEFCRDNPNSPMCRQGTWAGSCSTTFSCTGDAVQCAQAQAAYQFACEATKRTAQTDLGEQIIAGTDPLASTLPKSSNAETINLNVAGTINQAGWLSRSCPADEVFSYIGGQSFTVPWSTWCGYLQLFANLIVAACLLAAARIIGTGA